VHDSRGGFRESLHFRDSHAIDEIAEPLTREALFPEESRQRIDHLGNTVVGEPSSQSMPHRTSRLTDPAAE